MHPPSPDYVPGPEHPPSPDYVSGPEHPPSPVYVPYVPEPAYPEFMPLEDDVLPTEEQPLPAAVSPTADSSGYITEDDDEEESSRDDADDEDEDEDEDEEKEHLTLANSVLPPAYRTTARMSIPSPSLPASPTHPLGYRAAMIWLRAESPSTSHPLPLPPTIVLPHTRVSMSTMRTAAPSTFILAPRLETPPSGTPPLLHIPLPTSSPSLLLPSSDRRADVLEVTLPPQKRLYIDIGYIFEVRECSSAPTARPIGGFRADYGFVSTLDAEIRHDPDREIGYGITDVYEDPDEITEEIPPTDVAELSQRMTYFVTTIRDRRSYARTTRLMKSDARASREAWVQSMDASDIERSEVRVLQTTVLAQQTEIGELRAAERRRQTQLAEALTLLKILQTRMAALHSQQRLARDPAHPDVQKETGSSSYIWLCLSYVV
nr:hypothetical protein [Tanacetum cinerariifolium]